MNYRAAATELRTLRIQLRELRILNGTADTNDCMEHILHLMRRDAATQAFAGRFELAVGMYQGFMALTTHAPLSTSH